MWRPIQDLFPTAWSEHIQELKRGEDGGSRKRGGEEEEVGDAKVEEEAILGLLGGLVMAGWS